ncbi:fibrous sheath-interacting protein 1-like [Diadema setosum]|uniref:fibrous sheath-interacting protein 1-like n=1 Tax=Diadema setosum TaxID=31175 RepID=UPI003B3B9B4B
MDITRGSLDDITRPARTHRHRPGSRVSLNSYTGTSSPINRPPSNTSSSFEILPPDPDILLQETNDMAVMEYLSSSEDDAEDATGDDYDTNLDNKACSGFYRSENKASRVGGAESRIRSLDLLLAKTEESNDSASDADDVSDANNFEDGVESSHASPHSLNTGTGEPPPGEGIGKEEEGNEDPDADLAGITDPELRRAIKKMRKLDRILSTKVTREREVKRQRKLLHHQLEVELDSIKEEGGGKSREATENTTRFLALVPPISHDEGVNTDDIPSTPVFATQPPEGSPSHRAASSSSNQQSTSERRSRRSSKTSPRETKNQRRPRPPGGGGGGGTQGRKEDEPDFVQRNIDLASDAGSLIAMTDDEKKRLEDLLQDVEMLGEEDPTEATQPEVAGLQLKAMPGTGYKPDTDSQKLLEDIDEKLKNLLPADDFISICSTPSLLAERGTSSFNPLAFELGERILQETKESRTQQERLKDIEEELAHLQLQVEDEISSPSLSKAQLNALFQRCSEASDRTMTEITSPRLPAMSSTSSSPSASPRANTNQTEAPNGAVGSQEKKLSDDKLQQLLSEAKASLGLLALENAPSTRASSRTETEVTTSRESPHQLGLSLGDSPRSEMSLNTSRSLVSHDMIQQLLKNPRTTMLQSRNHSTNDHQLEVDRDLDDDELNASMDR